jgi:pimeloyl-ACP methyl ester carboxylesterase
MTADIDVSTAPLDHRLELAQAVYLERCAPGYRTRRVQWSGGSTQVIELDEGPALLLVHGGMGEALQYGSILPLLARRYRVIVVDRPGNGLADPLIIGESMCSPMPAAFHGVTMKTKALPVRTCNCSW